MTTTPTSPPPDDPILLVHAYVDGELDPANALAIEQRLAHDPTLAAERDRVEALRRLLHERLPRYAPSPALRERIETAIGLRRARQRPSWLALAASVAVATVISSTSTWFALAPRPAEATADAVVAAHIRALMAPQPTDVTSTDRHTVKPWFNGRIPEAPRVIDLASEGFPLVGGRLDVVGRNPVATLVYRHRLHLISLTAVPAAGRADEAPVRLAIGGYNLVHWIEAAVSYWAVSDMSVADLESFAQLFRVTPPDR
jgi:anti-sigma factor RsiW